MCYSDEKSIVTLLMVKYDENSCFHTLTIIPENEKHSVSIHLPLMNALCSFICKLTVLYFSSVLELSLVRKLLQAPKGVCLE